MERWWQYNSIQYRNARVFPDNDILIALVSSLTLHEQWVGGRDWAKIQVNNRTDTYKQLKYRPTM